LVSATPFVVPIGALAGLGVSMSRMIAVAGKGGVGKTTIAALVVKYLIESGRKPIFAVDADPNYTLGEALGIEVEQTIGMMREEFIGDRTQIPAGMSKGAVLEMKMQAAVLEGKDVDLIVMGRQEGPGCYCSLNNLLRNFTDTLSADYPYTVIDNEAGMEHLSRRNTRKIDTLLVVSDHSVKAAKAARRVSALVDELKIDVANRWLVMNRSPDNISDQVQEQIDKSELQLLVKLPCDESIVEVDATGSSILDSSSNTPIFQALSHALDKLFV
jgi:CO dehydrogenase maturation factor